MSELEELLPCPFCGEEDDLGDYRESGPPGDEVICGNCGSQSRNWNDRAGRDTIRDDRFVDYIGLFIPVDETTLRDGLHTLIGKKFRFNYIWTNENDESNYPGSRCYEIVEDRRDLGVEYIGWIPECDIKWA